MDNAQAALASGHFGNRQVLKGLLDRFAAERNRTLADRPLLTSQMITRWHYNQDVETLFENWPQELKAMMGEQEGFEFVALSNKFYGTKMLVFDWGRDPHLAGNKPLLAQVRKAQVDAMKVYLNNPNEPNAAAQHFVKNAGLLEAYRSLLPKFHIDE